MMNNPIIPKTAYLADYTLSVEDFLQMWQEETGGQEGEPTQVMYDVFCRSCAQERQKTSYITCVGSPSCPPVSSCHI